MLLGAQSLWKAIVGKYWRVVPPIIENRVSVQSDNSTSRCIQQMTESGDIACICTSVHSNVVHHNQMAEATQVSVEREVDKQNVLGTYNRILFRLKKEGN